MRGVVSKNDRGQYKHGILLDLRVDKCGVVCDMHA